MKKKIWRLLVSFIIILTLVSFLIIFKENKITPTLAGIPFIFWSGFLVSVLIVLATYLASKIFPYEEPSKS
jgi:uncharacterized membrane protein